MVNIQELKNKIKIYQDGVDSPVTPPAQREIFKQKIVDLENYLAEIEKVNQACQNTLTQCQQALEKAFSLTDGYCKFEIVGIAKDFKSFNVVATGQSPIVDADDVKKLKKQLIDLEDASFVDGKFTNAKITIATEEEVKGTLTIILNEPIQVINQ